MTAAQIRAELTESCRKSWAGKIGEERAAAVNALLDRILPEYAVALGISSDEVLIAIEERRDYNPSNYYQDANFPSLIGVKVFDTPESFKAAYPSGKYVCPSCAGHSTDPYACNTGIERDGKVCTWKSYGLFGTMGKGLRAIVKSTFLQAPKVHEIFMPIEEVDTVTA